jgi:hypothetical protein
MKNVVQVQRHCRNESETPPGTWVTITRSNDTSETDRTVKMSTRADMENLAVQLTMKVL